MSDATPGPGGYGGPSPQETAVSEAPALVPSPVAPPAQRSRAAAGEPRASSGGQAVAGRTPPGKGAAQRAGGRAVRGRRWRMAFFALAAFAILAGVAWALLGDRLLVVRSVTVTGTHLVSQARVIAAADVPPGTPLLRVDTGAVTRRVEAIPQVASARVTADWPDRLAIAVTERVPVLAVKMAGGGYDLVDHTGVPVRWAKSRPAGMPQLLTSLPGSGLAGAPSVSTAASVLAELQRWLASQVAQVSVTQAAESGDAVGRQVTLHLRSGKTVLWGGADRAGQKNRELAILLPGKARYVDVSAPGTVVTRLDRGKCGARHARMTFERG
jgi:cell division protein FtsQ